MKNIMFSQDICSPSYRGRGVAALRMQCRHDENSEQIEMRN